MATILSQKEESTMGNRCRLLYDGNEILLFSINENYTKSFSLTAAADADATPAPPAPPFSPAVRRTTIRYTSRPQCEMGREFISY